MIIGTTRFFLTQKSFKFFFKSYPLAKVLIIIQYHIPNRVLFFIVRNLKKEEKYLLLPELTVLNERIEGKKKIFLMS